MTPKAIKQKKCRICRTAFTPRQSFVNWCSVDCASELAVQKLEKAKRTAKATDKRETKAKLDAIKPRRKWLDECQIIVNKLVRLRDRHLGCCSCDKGPNWGGQWHASHLRSVGAASAVRFHLWNIHKACSVCNNHLSGNIAEYLPRVRARIGNERVDWVYTQNQVVRHGVDYLIKFKRVMGKRLSRMEKRNG